MAELRDSGRAVCQSAELVDGGMGVRFEIAGIVEPGFAVRYKGKVYAYYNRCAHLAVELDWEQGRFFDSTGEYLVCATHGALYHPATGMCIAGPCKGKGLVPLLVREINGEIRIAPRHD